MGREQGDELGNEVVYKHEDFDHEETAYTATDRVNLEARGWVQKSTKGTKAGPKVADSAVESGRA